MVWGQNYQKTICLIKFHDYTISQNINILYLIFLSTLDFRSKKLYLCQNKNSNRIYSNNTESLRLLVRYWFTICSVHSLRESLCYTLKNWFTFTREQVTWSYFSECFYDQWSNRLDKRKIICQVENWKFIREEKGNLPSWNWSRTSFESLAPLLILHVS